MMGLERLRPCESRCSLYKLACLQSALSANDMETPMFWVAGFFALGMYYELELLRRSYWGCGYGRRTSVIVLEEARSISL